MAEKKSEPVPPERQLSPGVEDRVLKAEGKMLPAWGRPRKKLEGWPKGRRR